MRSFLAFLLVMIPLAAQAQAEEPEGSVMEGLDDMADAIVWLTTRRWEGPRTPAPAPQTRPMVSYRLESSFSRVAVHAPDTVSPVYAERVLRILEGVASRLDVEGWPRPLPDGGLGGSSAFDLYLTPTDALAEGRSDGRCIWSYLDAAIAHGVVDPSLTGIDLEAAITSAYAQGVLLGLDPAEASEWHRAAASWLAWRTTGQFGPADSGSRQQQESWRSWVGDGAGQGEGGALFLAMMSERHDGGSGDFVRDLWQLTRQRTWDGVDLRAAPDLWQAIHRALSVGGDQLHATVEDLAVARWFLGEREDHSHFHELRGLGADATVRPVFTGSVDAMPLHTRASHPIETYGTAYATIDTKNAPPKSRLRVWLRGEYGVEWALTASRVSSDGRELARLSAPPRRGDRRSYLPVELTDDTEYVMISVTNLSHRLPDADDPDPNARAFRLIFDLVQEGQEPDYDLATTLQ
ncbi:MAG: hypothetical protein AAGE52_07070 [Myxococcota bacterium]